MHRKEYSVKKALFVGLGMVAMLSLASAPVFACDHKDANATSASASGCSAHAADAKLVGASGCTGHTESANATMTGDKAACPAQCSPEMMKYCKMTTAELAKFANYDGQVQLVPMSIKGMTCGGCESSVSAELTKTPGVVKVLTISYKDGAALVLVDPTKVKTETLATVVTNKGYDAQVLPAVAHMNANAAGTGKSCCAGGSMTGAKGSCSGKTETEAQETSAKQPN